jgi:PAS domain S-box-containing protein
MDTHQVSSQAGLALDGYLSRLLDSQVIGVILSDISGRILDANDAFLELVGYNRQDLNTGLLRWDQLTAPEFRAANEQAVAQIKQDGHALPFQKEYIHKQGHRLPVTVGVLALDDGGQHCLAYIVDHSAHKEVLKLLGESQERFRMLTEAIPNMVWTAHTGGQVDYANKRFFEFTGTSATENDGFSWQEVVHPDDLPALLKRGEQSGNSGRAFEFEARYRSRTGQYRWQLIRALPMEMTDGNTKWFGTCTDIDDQKRIETELREAEARLRGLAEAIPQIVWTAAASGEITFFNHRWFEYTRLSLGQSLSGGWQLLIHPEDLAVYMSEWNRALVSGDTFECKFRLKRAVGVRGKGGGYRDHLCRAVVLRDSSGQLVEWFGTWTDIQSPA